MDLNLDTLKREILEYLNSAGFALFHGSPGGLEGFPMVPWDSEGHPDYRLFLEVARKSGNELIVFACRAFDADDLDELESQLEDCELPREERREYESRLHELRAYVGVTCSVELAFDHHNRLYVYQARPDWYDDYLSIEDDLVSHMAEDDEMDSGDSLGGYFSKN